MGLLRRKPPEPEVDPWEIETPVVRENMRWMIRRDMPEILQIEGLCFRKPLSEHDFLQILRSKNAIGMVLPTEGPASPHHGIILGYILYRLERGHIEIVNLAVHPEWQRSGIGTIIIDRMKQKVDQQRRSGLRVCVQEYLVEAQLFFKAQGFEYRKTMPRYFHDGGDGYWFDWRQ